VPSEDGFEDCIVQSGAKRRKAVISLIYDVEISSNKAGQVVNMAKRLLMVE
jgi:hypothetical protein